MYQTIEEYNEQIKKLQSERNDKIKEQIQTKLSNASKKIKSVFDRFKSSIVQKINRNKDKVTTVKKEKINEIILNANIEYIKQQIKELSSIIKANEELLASKEIRSADKRHKIKEINKYIKSQINILSNELNNLSKTQAPIPEPAIKPESNSFTENFIYSYNYVKNKITTISRSKKESLIYNIDIKYLKQQNEILKELQRRYNEILNDKTKGKNKPQIFRLNEILDTVKTNLVVNEQSIVKSQEPAKQKPKKVPLKDRFKKGIVEPISKEATKVGTFSRQKINAIKKEIEEINKKIQEEKNELEFKLQKAEYRVLETKDRFKKGINDTVNTTKDKVGKFAKQIKDKFQKKIADMKISYQEKKINNLESKSSLIRKQIEKLKQYREELIEKQQLQPAKAGMSRGTVYVWFTALISTLLIGFIILYGMVTK